MAFEEFKEHLAAMESEARTYGKSSVEYLKLWTFRVVMKSLLFSTKAATLGILGLLMLVFVSVGGALSLGDSLENTAAGFYIIAGGYCLLLVVVFLIRDRLNAPMLRRFSTYFYDDEDA